MKHILSYIFFALVPVLLCAQSDPVLIIDGTSTTFKSGLSFPYWLKAGQTINLGSNVKSISALEFAIDNENLKFSQVLHITNMQTVPAGKAWKLESLGFGGNGQSIGGFSNVVAPAIFTSPKVFNSSGTYEWIVPPGVTNICVEVWGAGGAPYASYLGGGGGYGYECFTVIPGTHYTVTVGASLPNYSSSSGQSSSLGNLISATGGNNATSTAGGIGGTSTALFNLSGTEFFAGNNTGNGYGNQGMWGQVIIYW
jgi:hypothetical protein